MPIRTSRGRAAVYRRLWGAPMRSPRHLAFTLLVVALILVAVGVTLPRLFGGSSGDGGAAASSAIDRAGERDGQGAGAGTPGASDTERPTRLTATLVSPEPADADPRALTVASEWTKKWVHHPDDVSKKEWLAGLEPYTTPEFLPQMKTIRLANIPSTEVTGKPDAVNAREKSVVARVPTDGPELLVTVIDTGDGWRVADYERAQ